MISRTITGVAALALFTCAAAGADDPLQRDNATVIRYLSSLPQSAIGKRVPGVTLSDGTTLLKHARFLRTAKHLSRGQHVFLFEENRSRVAYVWVSRGGKDVPLARCKEEPQVLTGDVFTFDVVQASSGVVISYCPNSSW